MHKYKVIFMGTPEFAVPSLKSIANDDMYDIKLVVTQPDRKGNRGRMTPPPIKVFAEEKGIDVIQPSYVKDNDELFQQLNDIAPDFIVVVAYGMILPKSILDLPKFAAVNVHASLLPKYRGASPIQSAILNGDEYTGVTIMKMEEKLDAGDMISASKLKVNDMDYVQLSNALSQLGGTLVIETLNNLATGNVELTEQDESLATYTRQIKKSDGLIDFASYTAEEICRRLRAFEPWPTVYCKYKGDAMKIKEAEVILENRDSYEQAKPGDILQANSSGICVVCKEGILRIIKIQMPGKKIVDVKNFLMGNTCEIGYNLNGIT